MRLLILYPVPPPPPPRRRPHTAQAVCGCMIRLSPPRLGLIPSPHRTYEAADQDAARGVQTTLAMLQVLSQQSNCAYFMHMRAEAIVCHVQISSRARNMYLYIICVCVPQECAASQWVGAATARLRRLALERRAAYLPPLRVPPPEGGGSGAYRCAHSLCR